MSEIRIAAGRNYGMDLLKIITMFLIVVFHFSDHGTVTTTPQMPLTLNWAALAIARIFGAIGNCIFMFISGYFLCEKNYRTKRLAVLWLQVFFYSILCRIITIAMGLDPLGIKIVLKTLFPVFFQRYWYFSAYVIILIASPFLNIILKKLTKKQHFWLCVIMLTLFAVVPTIFKGTWLGGQIGNENYLKSFIALYITAGYVKFYGIGKIKKRSVYLWVALGIMLFEILSVFAVKLVDVKFNKDLSMFHFTWGMDRINVVIVSVCLFMWFKGLQIKGGKLIALLSGSSFGVYLLHLGTWKICFGMLFDSAATYDTPWLIPQMLGSAVLIYLAAILTDQVRIYLVEKPFIKLFDKLKWPGKVDALFDNLV